MNPHGPTGSNILHKIHRQERLRKPMQVTQAHGGDLQQNKSFTPALPGVGLNHWVLFLLIVQRGGGGEGGLGSRNMGEYIIDGRWKEFLKEEA